MRGRGESNMTLESFVTNPKTRPEKSLTKKPKTNTHTHNNNNNNNNNNKRHFSFDVSNIWS